MESTAVVTEVETVLSSMRGIWDEVSVDELDHALQAGELARVDGADDELIVAALLHDVAHSPLIDRGTDHDRAAREWLTPRLGARVGWLAGAHVMAKRFLAADAAYAGTLSDVSRHSLSMQGGVGAVGPDWTGHRWWADAIRLRRYDDGAKLPGAPAFTMAEALDAVRRVATGPR